MSPAQCPKCGRALTRGFVLDRRHHSAGGVARWVEGEPKHSFWFGIHLRGRRQAPMDAWRCDGCGYVELYAHAASGDA